jgi:hypothetical protein
LLVNLSGGVGCLGVTNELDEEVHENDEDEEYLEEL